MDRLMLRLRSKMDTDSVPMAETLRRLLKMRQQGVCPVVGFISDQSPIIYNVPYWTTFLNQETPFINGSERIARKLDYIAVYLDVRVVRRGHYEVTLLPIADHCAALPRTPSRNAMPNFSKTTFAGSQPTGYGRTTAGNARTPTSKTKYGE